MARPSQIRTERWQNSIRAQLVEIDELRRKLVEAEQTLETYKNEERERCEAFEEFREAGGITAEHWECWLREEPLHPRVSQSTTRHDGPVLIWRNPHGGVTKNRG
jgi:hypothetical protein